MATAPVAVLEVGCGGGAFLKDAAQRGCRVAGVEVDKNLVTELREAGIDAQLGRAEELPFEDRSFDTLVFQYVLHHCESLAQALRLEAILDEARRVGFSDDGAPSTAIRKRPSVGSHAIE
jgi:SAM-dependent methyltransferase